MLYCATCYGAYVVEVILHSCTSMLRRRLLDSISNPIACAPEIQNHNTGDVVLPPHVTHLPFNFEALNDAKSDEMGRIIRSSLL